MLFEQDLDFYMINLLLFITIATASPQQWAKEQLTKSHPTWKTSILRSMKDGKYTSLNVKVTRYSDLDSLDPCIGGGNKCWWGKKDTRLRWGIVAAAPCWPRGTVFYTPQLKRFWVVADRGPGVTSKNHIDVYCSNKEEWNLVDKLTSKKLLIYKVGYVNRKDYVR